MHVEQLDKAGKPYILHCLEVMYGVNQLDFIQMAIAVGHDIMEDTNVTETDLKFLGVSEYVIHCMSILNKHNFIDEEAYYQAISTNRDCVAVKMSDLCHNSDIRRLKGITQKDFNRTANYMKRYTQLEQQLQKFKAGTSHG
jgi:(p)ppGpp synthase/HD superfamily hydrolase